MPTTSPDALPPIVVFDLWEEGNIRRVVTGEPVGSLVHGGTS